MIAAKVVADSLSYNLCRVTTMELTYPRFIHAQVLTHRAFSRNSASSRAIPPGKFRRLVEENPAIPTFFGKNQKGMQAEEQINDIELAKQWWERARQLACSIHEQGEKLGLHKQLLNRVLEPYQEITTIVTATEWKNFFLLRKDDAAQPEMHVLANAMQQAYYQSLPKTLEPGEWHLPYATKLELAKWSGDSVEIDLARICAARCARISYLNHDGKADIGADIELAYKLESAGHLSPFEHIAQAMPDRGNYANFKGWRQYRDLLEAPL